ncbi:MAG TPA: hypothetical protein VMH87_10240 [Pseudomonadales bacterium]|nr:hypothetical protein [Pseudomonadales bacterium]
MHIILADSIDGGILMILLLGCGLAVSVLALLALIPAWQGSIPGTLVLAGPAIIAGIAATVYCLWGLFQDGSAGFELRDFLLPWTCLAVPPLATSLIAIFCLWQRRARAK